MNRPYGEVKIRADLQPWSRYIDLRIGVTDHDKNKFAVAQPVIFVEQNDEFNVAPCVSLQLREAQQLMDELWRCGLRPTEGTGSAGAMAATEKHLADMRKLAFHALKVQP